MAELTALKAGTNIKWSLKLATGWPCVLEGLEVTVISMIFLHEEGQFFEKLSAMKEE